MTTAEELGYLKPTGTDLVSKGDDVISHNADRCALMYDRRFDSNALAVDQDLSALTQPANYHAANSVISSSIRNRPPGFTSDPFTVEVSVLSGSNAVYEQRAKQKDNSGSGWRESVRYSLSGGWLPWFGTGPGGRMLANTNLNDIVALDGTYRAETSSVSSTIVNRPPWFTPDPFSVTITPVSIPNGIYEQRAKQKRSGSGAWVEAIRYSLSNKWQYEWIDPQAASSVRDRNGIALFGDSHTDTATSWDKTVSTLLNTTMLYNWARSGSTTDELEIRTGMLIIPVRVTGGSIPATGSVELTSGTRHSLRTDRLLVGGHIAGVGGSLTHLDGDVYRFTRSAAGTAVSVPGWTEFKSSYQTNAHAIIDWSGGNNFLFNVTGQERSIADHTLGHYRRFTQWCTNNGYLPIIGGTTNRQNEAQGTEGFESIKKINSTLRQLYPDIFLDIQAYMSERCIYDAGLTPTPADLAAVEAGAIPPQLYIDGDNVHFTPQAHATLGEYWIAPWLVAKGYGLTTHTIRELPTITPVF